jgi:hypothetical protein
MTTQLRNQELRSKTWDVLHCAQLALGRLTLSKGEGEGEGSGALWACARFKPLTSILSPCLRGEAEEISINQL